MNAPTTIKLTKAERMGLEEVWDHEYCARTWPVVLKLENRGFIEFDRTRGHVGRYKLTPEGKRALGIDPEARPL